MAIVFLNAINNTLKRVGVIQGDVDALATSTVTSTATGLTATDAFTRSGIQQHIDLAVSLWNEVQHEAYSMGLLYSEIATATITVTATVISATSREYAPPSDFERIAGMDASTRLMRATDGIQVPEYPGGYDKMLADQWVATDFVGTPLGYAINPVSGNIRFDTCFATADNGNIYNFLYHKRLSLTTTMATVAMPYSDTVADALVPVVAEDFQRWRKDLFDPNARRKALSRALQFLTKTTSGMRYGKRRGC